MLTWLKVITKIFILDKNKEIYSIIFILKYKILSKGLINNDKIDNGNIKIDINGTNIIFKNGDNKLISKKLFILMGNEDKKAIIEIINILIK